LSSRVDVFRLLACGATAPGDLDDPDRSARTVSRALRQLRDAGLVEGPRSLPQLSAAGRRAAGSFDPSPPPVFVPSPRGPDEPPGWRGPQLERPEDVGRARAALRARLEAAYSAIARVPPVHRPVAAGLRGALRRIHVFTGDARSLDDLADVADLAEPWLAKAEDLRWAVDQDQAHAERVRNECDAVEHLAKELASARRERQRQVRLQLGPLRKAWGSADRRTKIRPGEDVIGRLVELRILSDGREAWFETIDPGSVAEFIAPWFGRHELFRPVVVDCAGERYERYEIWGWTARAVRRALDAAKALADQLEDLYVEGVVSGDVTRLLAPPAPAAEPGVLLP
jgi:hypothetical protein